VGGQLPKMDPGRTKNRLPGSVKLWSFLAQQRTNKEGQKQNGDGKELAHSPGKDKNYVKGARKGRKKNFGLVKEKTNRLAMKAQPRGGLRANQWGVKMTEGSGIK